MRRLRVVDRISSAGIESICVEAPLDKARRFLEDQEYKVISLRDNAILRMQEGLNSFVSRNGNLTREGIVYIPKKGAFITRVSPLLADVKEATQKSDKGNHFYLTEEQAEEALQNSIKIEPQKEWNGVVYIPTNRFGEVNITNRVFGNIAKNYGLFLREMGRIKEMPIEFDTRREIVAPYATQIWFGRIPGGRYSRGRSVIDGSGRWSTSSSGIPRALDTYRLKVRGSNLISSLQDGNGEQR